MIRLPFQSAGRRFVKKFGFAFAWAIFFGLFFGALAYYRLPPAFSGEERSWHQRARFWVERFELLFFDWRARELGDASARNDQIVPVAIDDETLASAREDATFSLGGLPWPRETLGGMANELASEGASLVVLDFPFSDPSPRTNNDKAQKNDDEALRAFLDRSPGKSLITFGVGFGLPSSPERELRPYLLLVDSVDSFESARPSLRKILSQRAPAFLEPSGSKQRVWAGVASEEKAKELAESFGLPSPRTVRERVAADTDHEIFSWNLLASLAGVTIDGFDAARLPLVRSLEAPVPALLSEQSAYGVDLGSWEDDRRVRGNTHFVRFEPEPGTRYVLPSAAVAAAMVLAGSRTLEWADGYLVIGGKYTIPMNANGYSVIRWDAAESSRHARGSLKRSISAWRVLVNLRDARLMRGMVHHDNDLKDRVAILSNATTQTGPTYRTPIGSVSSAAVLGQSLANILQSDGLSRGTPRTDFLLTLTMAFLGACLAVSFSTIFRSRAGPTFYFLSLVVISTAYAYLARWVFLRDHQWIAVACPLFALAATFLSATGYAAALERRIREFITTAMGRSVNPEIAERLQRDISLMRPERRRFSVYRVDIVGFSALADKLEPPKLVELLNEFFTEATARVTDSGGHVDHYLGDALVAYWGAPVRMTEHASAACACALSVQQLFAEKGAEWEKRFGSTLDARAGLESGQGVAGDMGSEVHSNYTVVGEPVSMSFRLEALNRMYGTKVLVGDGTRTAVKGAFLLREIDRIHFRDEVRPVFELISKTEAATEAMRNLVAGFSVALLAYRERRFGEGTELFARLAHDHKDFVSELYEARCRYYATNPPADRWNGVYDGPV